MNVTLNLFQGLLALICCNKFSMTDNFYQIIGTRLESDMALSTVTNETV